MTDKGFNVRCMIQQLKLFQFYFILQQNCSDSHSIKLLNIIVTNKSTLGFSDSDIAKLVESFWNTMITDLNTVSDPDVYQSFVKFVFNFKSSEELIDMLTGFNSVRINLLFTLLKNFFSLKMFHAIDEYW